MKTRRSFFKALAASATVPTLVRHAYAHNLVGQSTNIRRFHFVQIDVFTSERLRGNPLCVFTDARWLSDSEMQDLARETNLQETTFVFPRDAAPEAENGIRVRIFTPQQELPFGGHPALGTAMVLRSLRSRNTAAKNESSSLSAITLDLKVGKIPLSFREDREGAFCEMRQVPPVFGPVLDRSGVAEALGLDTEEIEADFPIQTVSTGLPFAIVLLKRLNTLQSLRFNFRKVYDYLRERRAMAGNFYFMTRDTGDPKINFRARAIYPNGEDPATGSAAGCASAWFLKYGLARPDETVLIKQGVEIKRPSEIFVRSGKSGEAVSNVRVGGYAVQIMEGDASL